MNGESAGFDTAGAKVFTEAFFEEVLRPEWMHRPSFEGAGGFGIDTRLLQAGEVFIALKTEKRDGHDYLAQALEKGAAAAIVSDPQPEIGIPQIVVESPLKALQTLGAAWRKRWGGRVIGVTGSCGKTSTKEMLGLLLGRTDTFVTPGNRNNFIGVPLSELMLRPHHKRAVLEAGISEGGEMELLATMLDPDVAVVTTIGPAHLELLGSIEGVAREKSVLPRHAREKTFLGPACASYEAFAEAEFAHPHWVLPESRAADLPERGQLWTYALQSSEDGGSARVHLCNGKAITFPAPRATEGMIENTCLAVMVALSEGVPEADILERLAKWKPTAQRGEFLEIGGRRVYADHYNANPASFADAAHYFHRRFSEGPRVWVIGGMEELGPESAAWHRKLAAGLPLGREDRVFLIGGMTVEMQSALQNARVRPASVTFVPEIEEAIEEILESEGVLFLKGSRKYRLEKILDSLRNSE